MEAPEIVKVLMETKLWLFSQGTAKVKWLRAGDKFVVYAAGKGNRCFLGRFTLKTAPKALASIPEGLESLARLFTLGCKIEEAVFWVEPKPIAGLLPNLSFIYDKKNYGLYLRQGVRELSKDDYNVICE